jgi:glycosyltransferase involved in cell wall biosynthesis
LPILGIHSPGVSDTVEDGVTGYLSSNDVAAFTAKLTRLCVEPRRRRKLANAARQASYRYDIKHTGPEMLGHYERLAAAPRPRRRSAAESLNAVLERFLS